MKAIVKKEAKAGVWMDDVPVPTIGERDVLVKVHKSAICGTDIHIYQWDAWAEKNVPVGTVIGHEFMGKVVEVGSEVKEIHVGDRVSAEGHVVCHQCRNCREGVKHLCPKTKVIGIHRDGCFAEYVSVPTENIFKVPRDIPDDIAAIFDPLGNATHTALSFDLVGEDVLITGAGPIGMMAVAVARHAGARNVVVTDLNDYRLDLAKQMGATQVVNVSKADVAEVFEKMNTHFTVGLEMSGSPEAFTTLLQSLEPGGKIGLLGILPSDTMIDWDLVIFKMLEMKGIYGREIFTTWYKMSHMLQAGLDLSKVITHTFPAEEFQKGFDVMIGGKSGKVILNWD